MEWFLILVILLTVFTFLGSFFEVCWLPTRKRDYDRIAQLADIQSKATFYDLGSGGGGLLFYLAKKYHVNCVGIEISPVLYLYSKIKAVFSRGVTIKYGDFLREDLSKADIVYIFLHPKASERIKTVVLPKLKENSKLVISSWPLKDRMPDQMSEKKDQTPYFLYKKHPS